MISAPLPPDEIQRLAALRDFAVLDTPPELEFDDITALAVQICGTPIALITLVDEKRQWFKSKIGVTRAETSRDEAFCAHALLSPEVLLVPDARLDVRFADNPAVTGDPMIRFYAGAPLLTPAGHVLGTLCVIDRVPRTLTAEQQKALQVLSRHVMVQLRLRRHVREQARAESTLLALLEEQTQAENLARASEASMVRAQRLAHLGSREVTLPSGRLNWSEECYHIFGLDRATFTATYKAFLGCRPSH